MASKLQVGALKAIQARAAAEAWIHVEPQEDWAKPAPAPEAGQSPAAFLASLLEQGLQREALAFLAYALPKREALWWCAACVEEAASKPLPPAQLEALAAVKAWVAKPGDDLRRAALACAQKAPLGTPAGCCALGVFLSEGSLSLPNLEQVAPAEHLTGRALCACLSLCVASEPPERAGMLQSAFLARGLAAAEQPAPWDRRPA